MCTSALSGVFTFGILADYEPVQAARWAIAEGRGDTSKDAGGAKVGVLLEGLTDG